MKKSTKKLNAKKSAVYTYTGSRKELCAKLLELKESGKIKVADIARVAGVKSSSASCWLRSVSLPTENRVEALVALINSVSE